MRAEDAQGTPTQSHLSPSILVYKDNTGAPPFEGAMRACASLERLRENLADFAEKLFRNREFVPGRDL